MHAEIRCPVRHLARRVPAMFTGALQAERAVRICRGILALLAQIRSACSPGSTCLSTIYLATCAPNRHAMQCGHSAWPQDAKKMQEELRLAQTSLAPKKKFAFSRKSRPAAEANQPEQSEPQAASLPVASFLHLRLRAAISPANPPAPRLRPRPHPAFDPAAISARTRTRTRTRGYSDFCLADLCIVDASCTQWLFGGIVSATLPAWARFVALHRSTAELYHPCGGIGHC